MKQTFQGTLVALTGLVLAILFMVWVIGYEYRPAHQMASSDTSSGQGAANQSPWAIPDKIAQTGSDMADAEQIAKQTCATCHGVGLKGAVGPNLYDMSAKLSVQEIEDVLKNGRQAGGKQMPAGLVPSDKISEMAKFIKALSTTKA